MKSETRVAPPAITAPRRCKLAAVDLDGTLVRPDLTISEGVAAAVSECVSAGVLVVLATGRAEPSARAYHRQLGLAGPIISYQGAVTTAPDGRRWSEHPLPAGAIPHAADFAEARGDELTFYHADTIYFRRERQGPEFYAGWFSLPRRRVSDWTELPGSPTKLLVVAGDEAECAELHDAWSRRFGAQLEVVRSHPLFVEAVAPDVTKGRALRSLARRLGISRTDCLAVGDNENDIAMLSWAGTGVAMGGAPASVRGAADMTGPGVEEDGAAWALRRYALARDV